MASEKRLIDANDAYKYARGQYRDGRFTDEEYDAVLQTLDDAETVDAVEVVHGCKAESAISKTGLMCTACYSDIDRDAVFCKYCGAKMDGGNGDE